MGYNGKNRGISNRGYKGFSKSSLNYSNHLIFGRRGIVTGLLKLVNDSINSKYTSPTIRNSRYNYYQNSDANKADLGTISHTTIFLIIIGVITAILIISLVPTLFFIVIGVIVFAGLLRR